MFDAIVECDDAGVIHDFSHVSSTRRVGRFVHLRRIEPFIGPSDTFGYAGTT